MIPGTKFLDDDCGWELEDNVSCEENERDDRITSANIKLKLLVHSALLLVDVEGIFLVAETYPAMTAADKLVLSIRLMQ